MHKRVNIIIPSIEKSRQSGVYIGLIDRSDVNFNKVKATLVSKSKNKNDESMLGAFTMPTFDNSNEDAKIDGRVRNYGFGIFSRLNLPRDFYIDLMAKAGKGQTKVDTKDVDYKISMPYYNASFGVGKKIKFDSFIFDSGLNYALSYVGSDEADIGQSTLKFSSVTSSRAKIYSKIAYDAGKFNPYGKLALSINLTPSQK